MLLFRGESIPPSQIAIAKELRNIELLERAIGVIYKPMTERASHYLTARIARQFDAVIHLVILTLPLVIYLLTLLT